MSYIGAVNSDRHLSLLGDCDLCATGAIRTATLMHGMKRAGGKWGRVSMCMGAVGGNDVCRAMRG